MFAVPRAPRSSYNQRPTIPLGSSSTLRSAKPKKVSFMSNRLPACLHYASALIRPQNRRRSRYWLPWSSALALDSQMLTTTVSLPTHLVPKFVTLEDRVVRHWLINTSAKPSTNSLSNKRGKSIFTTVLLANGSLITTINGYSLGNASILYSARATPRSYRRVQNACTSLRSTVSRYPSRARVQPTRIGNIFLPDIKTL